MIAVRLDGEEMEISIPIEELQKKQLKIMVATPMYGGMCTGNYSKSIADLAVTCARLGVGFQLYYLYNESLIQRARNYCVDEFLRSDCTHLMFIDADIGFNAQDVVALLILQDREEKYDVIGGAYPKKCLPSTTKVFTKDGIKTIASIVNEKYQGEVKSLDKSGNIVWKKVTNHWKSKNNNKKFIGLVDTPIRNGVIRDRSKVVCTDDHEIAYVDDPLNPVIRYTEAKNMLGKYIVQSISDKRNIKDSYFNSPIYNKEQISVILGTSLSDGYCLDGKYKTTHPKSQIEYSKYISNILNSELKNNSVSIPKNGQTEFISELLYDKNKKRTLKNIIERDLIDPIVLAFMYMDDGNRYYYPEKDYVDEKNEFCWWVNTQTYETKRSSVSLGDDWIEGRKLPEDRRKPTASLFTMKYTKEDNELLSKYLLDKYNIKSIVKSQKEKEKDYYFLWFDSLNTDKLHKLICPYVCSTMEYKLNEEYRGCLKHKFDDTNYQIGLSKIHKIIDIETTSMLYDIEVEDTHNFFVNSGVLVHNCISWEKIKLAVDKGFADKDPNILDKFVGDYVFNPKNGAQSIRIDEPAEVLEIGTGFMMIRRSVFDRFKEAFPEYAYKPDHARTEHFKGDREIVAYFDCSIDPETRRYLSEDYHFCQLIQKIGCKIWLCPWMQLTHTGTMIFGGSLADIASIGASATA
jgi:hypothetical protein